MNVTVTLTGTLEEITLALSSIEKNQKRANELLPVQSKPLTLSDYLKPSNPPAVTKRAKNLHSRVGRKVDVYMGSAKDGFMFWKTFVSGHTAADAIGMTKKSGITSYISSGATILKRYKVAYHNEIMAEPPHYYPGVTKKTT